MSYPANLDTIVVRHKITDAHGRHLKGNQVSAVPTKRVWTTDGSVVEYEHTTPNVGADGFYEIEVPYVDQPGIHNKGVPWKITEHVPGKPRHYFIAPVLAHGSGPIDATEALVEAPVGYEVKIQAGPVTDETAAQLLDQDGQFKARLTGTFATHERLVEVATGQEAALTDSAVTGALTGEGNAAKAVLDGKVGKGEPLGSGIAPNPDLYQARILASGGSAQALRVDQRNTQPADAVKIVNESPAYSLKVDHTPATPSDAVNIYAPGPGAYTALGVGGWNTSLSTVKITNNAAQTGGAVLAAYGTVKERTAQIIGAENYGTGASFSAHQWEGANAPAFRAIYDDGYNHDARALWIAANHVGGSIVYVNNPTAQTGGEVMFLGQANAASTAGVLRIVNAGSGDTISAPGFSVAANGTVRANAMHNTTSFRNARVQVTPAGAVIDRDVAGAGEALRINQANTAATGDILQLQASGAVRSRVTKAGHIATRVTTAPADGDLVNGEAAFWLDSTNGAARLMVKAKQADGTVRTGSVTLA